MPEPLELQLDKLSNQKPSPKPSPTAIPNADPHNHPCLPNKPKMFYFPSPALPPSLLILQLLLISSTTTP
eukprot:15152866-Ditylum_brightwellii.AAC.1